MKLPVSRRRPSDDFSDEVQAHLDLETDRLVAEGLTPAEARDAARRAFGNVARANERFYEASRWMWLDRLAQDVRYAARGLRHNPAFLATTVLTLAIGLGRPSSSSARRRRARSGPARILSARRSR